MQFPLKIFLIGILLLSFTQDDDFLTQQKRYARVRTAISEKENLIKEKLDSFQLQLNRINLLFVAFKEEDILEVYLKKKGNTEYVLFDSYPVCAKSGILGPKRKEGDGQVPEGFYHIDRFNPVSSYYLSLGVNYPNVSDKKKSNAARLGGDIFIHGNCVTIGCLPMTDELIKEIYVLAIHARNNGQTKIPVYIFPFKMTEENYQKYASKYSKNEQLVDFWANLKQGYVKFTENHTELSFSIAQNGDYLFR